MREGFHGGLELSRRRDSQEREGVRREGVGELGSRSVERCFVRHHGVGKIHGVFRREIGVAERCDLRASADRSHALKADVHLARSGGPVDDAQQEIAGLSLEARDGKQLRGLRLDGRAELRGEAVKGQSVTR